MGRTRGISAAFLDRGLLRAVLLAFALFLAYRFLAQVATMVLLLAAGLLLSWVLSAPVAAVPPAHARQGPGRRPDRPVYACRPGPVRLPALAHPHEAGRPARIGSAR